jgi:hypothetical protein
VMTGLRWKRRLEPAQDAGYCMYFWHNSQSLVFRYSVCPPIVADDPSSLPVMLEL